jgi:hypothetical protein
MSGVKYLNDVATRQEHLSELAEWLGAQVNVWAREFKNHHSPDDKLKLAVYEAALKLLKGYLDSFTTDIVTDVEEPKVERERLGDVDTRYNHLVTLMEMWRDAAEFIKNHHVGKIVPTSDLNKIRMFEKTVELIEVYQESMAGEFNYPGVSRTYPGFKDGQARLLRPVLEEAERLGIAANKKRLLDAANEKIESAEETEGASGTVEGRQVSGETTAPDSRGNPRNEQTTEDDDCSFT